MWPLIDHINQQNLKYNFKKEHSRWMSNEEEKLERDLKVTYKSNSGAEGPTTDECVQQSLCQESIRRAEVMFARMNALWRAARRFTKYPQCHVEAKRPCRIIFVVFQT